MQCGRSGISPRPRRSSKRNFGEVYQTHSWICPASLRSIDKGLVKLAFSTAYWRVYFLQTLVISRILFLQLCPMQCGTNNLYSLADEGQFYSPKCSDGCLFVLASPSCVCPILFWPALALPCLLLSRQDYIGAHVACLHLLICLLKDFDETLISYYGKIKYCHNRCWLLGIVPVSRFHLDRSQLLYKSGYFLGFNRVSRCSPTWLGEEGHSNDPSGWHHVAELKVCLKAALGFNMFN